MRILRGSGRGNGNMLTNTAAEALERIERASEDDLVRKYWYEGNTLRLRPSGILRVLGDDLNGSSVCPPQNHAALACKSSQYIIRCALN
jgi:hypothetical protein